MSSTDFQFVQIPEHLKPIIGTPDRGTRLFRRFGSSEDYRVWWDAVCEICGEEGAVSPGGVSMYAQVSRSGVHKRMKEGRITVFLFHVVKGVSRLTRREKLENSVAYTYIPGLECKAWAEIIARLPSRQAADEAIGDGDFQGRFLAAKGRKLKKGGSKQR
jgi:hypothetical protein